jgi:hypothetical protein
VTFDARLRGGLAALAACFAMLASPAHAGPVSVIETDAGDSLATAQDARNGYVNLMIEGTLSNEPDSLDLVDMYRIDLLRCILGASTGLGFDTALIADPVLYLFDGSGMGVAMDDESGGNGQAFFKLVNQLQAGDYYLAIAFAGVEPVDANGNPIFDTFGTGAVMSMSALAGWIGSPLAINPGIIGDYQIAVDVPSPGTLALVAGGLFFLIRRQRVQPLQSGSAA